MEYHPYVTQLEIVLPYLRPIDHVRLISACKYLRSKHQGNIPQMRRNSLAKFFDEAYDFIPDAENTDEGVKDLRIQILTRGYKLPNGKLEGMHEELRVFNGGRSLDYYQTLYANGKELEMIEWSVDEDKGQLVCDMFETWKHIDINSYGISSGVKDYTQSSDSEDSDSSDDYWDSEEGNWDTLERYSGEEDDYWDSADRCSGGEGYYSD